MESNKKTKSKKSEKQLESASTEKKKKKKKSTSSSKKTKVSLLWQLKELVFTQMRQIPAQNDELVPEEMDVNMDDIKEAVNEKPKPSVEIFSNDQVSLVI